MPTINGFQFKGLVWMRPKELGEWRQQFTGMQWLDIIRAAGIAGERLGVVDILAIYDGVLIFEEPETNYVKRALAALGIHIDTTRKQDDKE